MALPVHQPRKTLTMSKLEFHGVVDWFADPTEDRHGGTVSIGGRDIIHEIEAAFGDSGKVTVAIADETFTGDLYLDQGSRGYSELTPGDVAELKAGPHSVIHELYRYHKQVVTMWVSNEPLDLGDTD